MLIYTREGKTIVTQQEKVTMQKLAKGDRLHIFTGVYLWKPFTYCSSEENFLMDFTFSHLNDDQYSFYIANQEMAWYSLCSAGENFVSWEETLTWICFLFITIYLIKTITIFHSCCYLATYLLLKSPYSLALHDLRV